MKSKQKTNIRRPDRCWTSRMRISGSAAMCDRELLYLGRRILAVAVEWRDAQDEVLQAAHSATVAVRQGNRPDGQDLLPAVLAEFHEDYVKLCLEYGEQYIEAAIATLLSTEIFPLSALFSGLYVEFNGRYFDDGLPPLRVRITYDAVHGKDNLPEIKDREMVLAYYGYPEDMVALLLEGMALISASQSDEDFEHELDRLESLNAPTRSNIDERRTGEPWPWERSAYGPVLIDQFAEWDFPPHHYRLRNRER